MTGLNTLILMKKTIVSKSFALNKKNTAVNVSNKAKKPCCSSCKTGKKCESEKHSH